MECRWPAWVRSSLPEVRYSFLPAWPRSALSSPAWMELSQPMGWRGCGFHGRGRYRVGAAPPPPGPARWCLAATLLITVPVSVARLRACLSCFNSKAILCAERTDRYRVCSWIIEQLRKLKQRIKEQDSLRVSAEFGLSPHGPTQIKEEEKN